MTSIVFVSNFYNHHQRPLANELYKLTGGRFRFIERMEMPASFKHSGYGENADSTIVIKSWASEENKKLADDIILNYDVLINGGEDIFPLINKRLKKGLITFEVGERWFKKGYKNLLSPRLIKSQLYYHLNYYKRPYYHLNASAYAANDLAFLHAFKNKMYKWGYFTEIPKDFDKECLLGDNEEPVKILYVARFIGWKHPELAIQMAENLTRKGLNFELRMYGNGPEWENIKNLIHSKNLQDKVLLKGNLPNHLLMEEMKNHHIVISTSDRNEGWGAIINEAMGCKCAVVASNEIGAVPYLIENGRTGFVFQRGDAEELSDIVESLILTPGKIREVGEAAYKMIKNEWSPAKAAENLLKLIDGLRTGKHSILPEGPCSVATPI